MHLAILSTAAVLIVLLWCVAGRSFQRNLALTVFLLLLAGLVEARLFDWLSEIVYPLVLAGLILSFQWWYRRLDGDGHDAPREN